MAVRDHRPKRIDVPLRAGDSFRLGFVVKDSSGSAVDVSSWTLSAAVRPEGGSSVAITADTTTDGTDGRIYLAATVAQLTTITWAGHYELRRTDTETTLITGRLIMEDDTA